MLQETAATTLATMSTFGGGMGIGSVCGALTGGIAALGVLVKDDENLKCEATVAQSATILEGVIKEYQTNR